MRILAEIDRHPHVPHEGKIICREAVRAVILRGSELLLVHSKVNGDYKFPGGGVQEDEDQESALIREVAEESGGRITTPPQPFGKVQEYDFPAEKEFTSFCMTSYYYLCEIEPVLGTQQLDEYEARLGFVPEWVNIDKAIENNQALLASDRKIERWVMRETRVLEIVRDELIH
ncbi:MAG TPA: DNA mismatch repair protein MutT [Anaerolineaceae bacterium]|nr:DNA mismatch repair protein MutT [Anaerolineaceae bacterium]